MERMPFNSQNSNLTKSSRRRNGMKNLKKNVLTMALIIVWLSFVAMPALGQQKYVLKFNHVLGPSEPYHQGFLNWSKAVEEKTKRGAVEYLYLKTALRLFLDGLGPVQEALMVRLRRP